MIIPATSSDIKAIADLMENFYKEEGYHFDKANIISSLNTFTISQDLGQIFLVIEERSAIGYAIVVNTFCFELGGRIGYIDELYIEKEHRGKGHASHLLTSIISTYKDEHYAALRLEVEDSNPRAQALYNRIGFKSHARALMSHQLR